MPEVALTANALTPQLIVQRRERGREAPIGRVQLVQRRRAPGDDNDLLVFISDVEGEVAIDDGEGRKSRLSAGEWRREDVPYLSAPVSVESADVEYPVPDGGPGVGVVEWSLFERDGDSDSWHLRARTFALPCRERVLLEEGPHPDWRLDFDRDDHIPRHELARAARRPSVGRAVDSGQKSSELGPLGGGGGWRAVFATIIGRREPAWTRPLNSEPRVKEYLAQPGRRGPAFHAYVSEQGVLASALGTSATDPTWLWELIAFGQAAGIERRHLDAYACPIPENWKPPELPEAQDRANGSWVSRRVASLCDLQSYRDTSETRVLDRLINGMCPHEPYVVENDGSFQLVWTFTWTGSEQAHAPRYKQCGDGRLPDIEVWSSPVAKAPADAGYRFEHPERIEAIKVRFPGDPAFQSVSAPEQDRSGGSPDSTAPWPHALRLVRQAILLAGQLDWHVARCHFYVEQLCVMLCGALRGSEDHPLLEAMWPYLRSADEINRFGEETLFSGKGLLVTATSLTASGASRRIRHQLSAWGWADFQPPMPLTPNDRFRVCGRIMWTAIDNLVEDWKLDAFERPSIAKASESLEQVRQSMLKPDRAVSRDVRALAIWGRGGDAPNGEGPDESVSSLRRAPGSAADWKQLAKHALWCATFLHDWIGGSQFADGSQVALAPLGLQWRAMPKSGESLTTHGPHATNVGAQLALAELLGKFRWAELAAAKEEEVVGTPSEPYAKLSEAIDKAVKPGGKHSDGEIQTFTEWARDPGVDGWSIRTRICI